MSKKSQHPIYVFDLDGTLSVHDPTGRVRFLNQQPKDWKAFHAAAEIEIVNDPPREDIITLLRDIAETPTGPSIYIITGRSEKYRVQTQQWLQKHDIPYDDLFMRGLDDFRQDAIIKSEIIESFKHLIICVFEDRDQCVAMYRELGITCCQVDEGAF